MGSFGVEPAKLKILPPLSWTRFWDCKTNRDSLSSCFRRNISFVQITWSNNSESDLWETLAHLCASTSVAFFPPRCFFSPQFSCWLASPIKSPIKQSMSRTKQSDSLQKTIKKTEHLFYSLVVPRSFFASPHFMAWSRFGFQLLKWPNILTYLLLIQNFWGCWLDLNLCVTLDSPKVNFVLQ